MLEFDEYQAAEFERIQELVGEIRFITSELPGKKRYDLLFSNDNLIAENSEVIRHLSRVPQVLETDTPRGFNLAVSGRGAWLDVPAVVLAEYKTELEKMLAETEKQIENLEKRLSNESYISKAPAELVAETRENLSEKRAQLAKIEHGIANL